MVVGKIGVDDAFIRRASRRNFTCAIYAGHHVSRKGLGRKERRTGERQVRGRKRPGAKGPRGFVSLVGCDFQAAKEVGKEFVNPS